MSAVWPDALCDWRANDGRRGIQCLLVLFRLSQCFVARPGAARLLGRLLARCYTTMSRALYGFDLPVATDVGPGLVIYHGVGLVVNSRTRIGANVTLRHNTTLGGRRTNSDCPSIGANVDVGPHVVIIGAITIGAGARVGAGSVVIHDVPEGAVVAGNPATSVGARSDAESVA